MIDRVHSLIEKAKRIRFSDPIPTDQIEYLEKTLNVELGKDFKNLSEIYSYEDFYCLSFFNWCTDPNDDTSVVEATKRFRGEGLPHNYIVLSEESGGVVLMKIPENPNDPSKVIWCAVEDFYNLSEGKPMQYNPTIFHSFTDFFEFLIQREEEDRVPKSS